MALLDAFKQQVLSLGRSEARAKARPLLVDDESFERSAAGLDRRTAEGFVMFWLLSDRAVYLVAGGADGDWAFRIPYGCVDEMALDFDENAEMLPWYVRLALATDAETFGGAPAVTERRGATRADPFVAAIVLLVLFGVFMMRWNVVIGGQAVSLLGSQIVQFALIWWLTADAVMKSRSAASRKLTCSAATQNVRSPRSEIFRLLGVMATCCRKRTSLLLPAEAESNF